MSEHNDYDTIFPTADVEALFCRRYHCERRHARFEGLKI